MARTLQQLDYSILQQCMHCGMCLPTCPTYDSTKHERHSPRGRVALMRAIADGELTVTREFGEEMSFCLGCLACQSACPAGVNYAELFEAARAEVETKGVLRHLQRSFWRAITLRFLFVRPAALRLVGRLLGFYQRTGLESFVRKMGLTRLLPANLRRLEPATPVIAAKFSHQLIAPVETPTTKNGQRNVALLTGCVQDLVFSDINRDTADVLLRNGCAVYTPPEQPCCGSIHAHNGEMDLARQQARRMIDLLPPENYDAIISNAGGCGAHLRHYRVLLADDPAYASRAKLWDAKLKDIHEWLIEIGCRPPKAAPFEQPITVTYHESCHLAHGQKVTRQPRQVLRLIPGVTFIELPESAWCCGSAGIYSITQPEQSNALLARKVRNVLGTGARVLATSNPGCHLHIQQGLRKEGSSLEIIQPVTLLARAYRREG